MKLTEKLANTAAACRILSQVFYKAPTELFLKELLDNDVVGAWPTLGNEDTLCAAKKLISESLVQDGYDKIERDHYHLFIGPMNIKAHPWGSVYLDKENLLFSDSTVEFQQFCKDNEVEFSLEDKEPSDHIGLIFATLSALINNKQLYAMDQLLEHHLMSWAPRMLALTHENAETTYYQGFAILAGQLLTELVNDRALLPQQKQLFR